MKALDIIRAVGMFVFVAMLAGENKEAAFALLNALVALSAAQFFFKRGHKKRP